MTNSESFGLESPTGPEEAQVPENAPPEFRILRTSDVDVEERSKLGLGPDEQPTALCLSGGGIRSAAFCLGVLQAFAARSLLHQVHYLSTVSGGGYIGGWLTRCIAEQNAKAPPEQGDVKAVLDRVLVRQGEEEAPELGRLRSFTNFLTPHPGIVSSDTWAGIELYARNTLINWTVFLPLMLAAAFVPIFYLFIVCYMGSLQSIDASVIVGIIGLASLAWAVHLTCIKLPSYTLETPEPVQVDPQTMGLRERQGPKNIVVWTLAWTILVPLCLAPGLLRPDEAFGPMRYLFSPLAPAACATGGGTCAGQMADASRLLDILPIGAFAICVIAYLAAWRFPPRPLVGDPRKAELRSKAFVANFPGWTISSALSASMLWLGAWLATGRGPLWIAFAGPVWVMGAEMLRSAAYSAVRRDGLRSDLDREWLARLSGDKVRYVLALGALGAIAVFLPTLILDHPATSVWGPLAAVAGFLAGPVGAWLGSSAKSAFLPSTKDSNQNAWLPQDSIMAAAIGTAISVFAVSLFMLLGRLAAIIIRSLAAAIDTVAPPWASETVNDLLPTAGSQSGQLWLVAAAGLLGVLFYLLAYAVLGKAINLNRFSMHAVYRNRLVRAFLGTARPRERRHPDPYTNFDPRDNVRVADTFDKRVPKRLFPVINVALNRTSGKDTARAERKAEPFTITPLHCGSPSLDKPQGEPVGAYVPTRFFAGGGKETGPFDDENGITLGTAMTLSGAAVSPNMGYHSSPFVAFVMTLFNLRLGAWLPNPGGKPSPTEETMTLAGPNDAIGTMLKDLIGQSDDQGAFVYLSDGGHYDNLGLDEMLRRRCGFIVVVDAGEDGNYTYGDLGRALEYAMIDQGVQVTFDPPLKVGGKKSDERSFYASIDYPKNAVHPPVTGKLLYIKPVLPDDAPAELKAFAERKDSFPHESTTNQGFTESDFESYRRLGEYLAGAMLTKALGPRVAGEAPTLAGLMRGVSPPSKVPAGT